MFFCALYARPGRLLPRRPRSTKKSGTSLERRASSGYGRNGGKRWLPGQDAALLPVTHPTLGIQGSAAVTTSVIRATWWERRDRMEQQWSRRRVMVLAGSGLAGAAVTAGASLTASADAAQSPQTAV